MPKAATSADVRERIFASARELFAHHGYLGTTTRKICERASVPLGSLHYHFESKEALYVAVLESVLGEEAEIGRLIEKEISGEGTADSRAARLERLVRRWVDFLFCNTDVARIGLHRIVEEGVKDFPVDTPLPLPSGRAVEGLLERTLGVPRTPGARAQILAANDIVAAFVGGAAHHARILGIAPHTQTYRKLVTRTVLALYAPLVQETTDGP
jgi:AcrR family transcriptional regulator